MPVLNASPLETALPPAQRRRLWKQAELQSHSLVVLTFDQIRLAPLSGPPRRETIAAVESGGDLDELLGPLATAIELTAVRRVRLELLANTVVLEYREPGRGMSRLTIVFTTPVAADACFTRVWRRLGERCSLLPYHRDWWALAKAPLLALAAALAITAALSIGLGVSEETNAHPAAVVSVPSAGEMGTPLDIPKAAPPWLGWKAVCGLGGVAAALTQIWLYRRVTQPPAVLELARVE